MSYCNSYTTYYDRCNRNCYEACNPCYNPCYTTTNNNNCCPPTPTPPVNNVVSYIAGIPTANAIPSGGAAIPNGTIIPAGSTTVPAGTVTPITGYTGTPVNNQGGISLSNGFFTVPIAGRYAVAAYICFAATDIVFGTDLRAVSIYRVDALTNATSQIATDARVPITGSNTCVNISTVAELNAGDRIFVAARQVNAAGAVISTVAGAGRIAITRF